MKEDPRPPLSRRRKLLVIGSIVLTFGVQLILWWSLPHDSFWVVDPGAKFLQVENFTLEGRAIQYPGRDLDPDLRYSPFFPLFIFEHRGEFYGTYNPLFIGLSTLFFRLLGFSGLYVISLLSSLLIGVVVVALTRELTDAWLWTLPAVVGLTSPLLFYAFTFWEHELGVLLATAALLLVFRSMEGESRLALFLAGATAGLGVAIRSELAVWSFALVVSLLLVWRGRRKVVSSAFVFGAGAVVVLAAFQLYELFEFGTFAKANVAANYMFLGDMGGWAEMLASRLDVALIMLTPSNEWLVLWAAALLLSVSGYLGIRGKTKSLGFSVLSVVALVLLIVNLTRYEVFEDVVQTFPLLVFAGFIAAAPKRELGERQKRLVLFIVYSTVVFTALAVLTAFNAGGAQWGPRYLLPIFPVLAVVLVAYASRIDLSSLSRRAKAAGIVMILALVSLGAVTQWLGVRQLRQRKLDQKEMVRQLRALPESIVLVDNPFSALGFAPAFYDKKMMQVADLKTAAALVQDLDHKGVGEFAYVSVMIGPAGSGPLDLGAIELVDGHVVLVDEEETVFPVEMRPPNLETLRIGNLGRRRLRTSLRFLARRYSIEHDIRSEPRDLE